MSIAKSLKKSLFSKIRLFSWFFCLLTAFAAKAQPEAAPMPNNLLQSMLTQMMPLGLAWGFAGAPPSPFAYVFGIIRLIMNILGIIFICLIVYGGFIWLTAAGDETRIDKAKEIIRSSTIGVAIIICAYAITRFVIGGLVCAVDPNQWWCYFFENY